MDRNFPINRDERSENVRVVRAAGIVGTATMLSRVFGLVRDTLVAGLFGAGLATDAFFVAFRIPNLLRRLLAEGSLTVSFVPVFTDYLRNRTREEALELADISFTALSILLAGVSLLLKPAVGDGQFLFMQHILWQLDSKGLAVVVADGSTLFSGDAGSGVWSDNSPMPRRANCRRVAFIRVCSK